MRGWHVLTALNLAAANVTLYQLRDRVGTQQTELAALRTEVERLQGAVDRLTALIGAGQQPRDAIEARFGLHTT